MNALKLSAWSVGVTALYLAVGGAVFYSTSDLTTAVALADAALATAAIVAVFLATTRAAAAAIVASTTTVLLAVGAVFASTTAAFILAVFALAFATLTATAAKEGGASEPPVALFLAALPGTNIIVLAACLVNKLCARSAAA